jgi:hypothetical protein
MNSITTQKSKHHIIIRNATKNDIQNIIIGWKNAYGKRVIYKYPQRWQWQFEKNPFLPDYQSNLPIWIAIKRNKVVGWSCAMIVKGKIMDFHSHIAYATDMYVNNNYRGLKVGLNLRRENQKNHPIFMSIQMGKGTRNLNYKIGGKSGPPLKIYLKLLKSFDPILLRETIFEKFKAKKMKDIISKFNTITKNFEIIVLSKILSYLIKYKQNKNRNNLKIKNKMNYQFEKIYKFGDEADIFWNKIKADFGFSVDRGKTYLNWRYVAQPQMVYEKYYLKDEGEIVGLIIYRLAQKPEINYGVITEFIAINQNRLILNAMLKFAENKIEKAGASSIRCAASIRPIENILAHNNYQLTEIKTPVIYIDHKKLSVQHDQLIKFPWLMSLGDQDIDIPFLNQQPHIGDILKILKGQIIQT